MFYNIFFYELNFLKNYYPANKTISFVFEKRDVIASYELLVT